MKPSRRLNVDDEPPASAIPSVSTTASIGG
jgi:hypothetical protein